MRSQPVPKVEGSLVTEMWELETPEEIVEASLEHNLVWTESEFGVILCAFSKDNKKLFTVPRPLFRKAEKVFRRAVMYTMEKR